MLASLRDNFSWTTAWLRSTWMCTVSERKPFGTIVPMVEAYLASQANAVPISSAGGIYDGRLQALRHRDKPLGDDIDHVQDDLAPLHQAGQAALGNRRTAASTSRSTACFIRHVGTPQVVVDSRSNCSVDLSVFT